MKGLFLDAVWSSPSLARISLPVIEPLLYSNVREFSSCPDSSKETQINLSMARFCSCPVCTSNHWSDFLVGPVTHFFRIDTINPTIASKLNRKCVPMFRSPIQPQFFFLFSFFFFDEQGTRPDRFAPATRRVFDSICVEVKSKLLRNMDILEHGYWYFYFLKYTYDIIIKYWKKYWKFTYNYLLTN